MGDETRDTSPDAERFLMERWRELTPAERIERVWAMTRTVMAMQRDALRRANPSLSERELALLIIRTNYGADLAARVDEHMRKQGR